MAPSFDCVASSLFCAEDNIFDDYATIDDEYEKDGWNDGNRQTQFKKRSLEGGERPPSMSDECIALLVEKERHYLPEGNYSKRLESGDLDFGARKEAVEWIQKVSASFNFGPLCTYLAISYLDRFLSLYDLPKGKAWTMHLVSVACLSLAAKLEETEVPLSLDLQVGASKFVFEAKTIQRMELLVLSTLNWRMQAITPFSFIDFFLCKIGDDRMPFSLSMSKASRLILSTVQDSYFLESRPSEIAVAVAISVAGEIQAIDADKAISTLTHHVEKEKVLDCVRMIQKVSMKNESESDSRAYIRSSPSSPSGVLDVLCFSSASDGSDRSSSGNSRDRKRRNRSQSCKFEP